MTDMPPTDTTQTGMAQTGGCGSTFAERHALLARGYGGRPDPVDPAHVLAMPIVLHIPKADPPRRSAVLSAAASAAVALCLDERVGAGGDWELPFREWVGGRIRKIARRARGAQWVSAQEVPGITVEVDGASARALVPGRVGDLDPRIKRLQIGGTDLEPDAPPAPVPNLPVFWVDAGLEMTVGKAAAQVGHASMLLAGALSSDACREWADLDFACSVRDADTAEWERVRALLDVGRAVAVRDAGFTEVAPGSTTVLGVSSP